MSLIKKFSMYSIPVKDMPKATNFYADALGLEVTQDYRQDEKHWWISLAMPEGGVTITLSLEEEGVKPGTLAMYFITSDINAAHKQLSEKGIKVSEIQDDLYGPGSGVKFIDTEDPEGNKVLLVQE